MYSTKVCLDELETVLVTRTSTNGAILVLSFLQGFGGTDYGYLCPRSQVYIVSVPGAILICTLTETQFEELKNNNSTDEIKNGKLHLSDITFKFKVGGEKCTSMNILGYHSCIGLYAYRTEAQY